MNRYEQNFEKANRLLDEAGYPLDKTGKRFSFRLIYMPERAGINRKIAEYLRRLFLRNLGVEAVIEHPADFKDWMQKVSNGYFQMTTDELPLYPLFQPIFAITGDRNLGWTHQSIWGLMSPLDTVYWRQMKK